jgi:hypothetical protein
LLLGLVTMQSIMLVMALPSQSWLWHDVTAE